MEEQRKKKGHQVKISGGGGGIAGLLVLGGALAITGFMAVAAFAANKNKKKGSQVPQESDHGGSKTEDKESEASQGKGLRSLLREDSTTTEVNACSATYATPEISMHQINPTDLLSVPTLIIEEKPGIKTSNEESQICSFHQEIVLSDDSHPASVVSESLNDNGVEELDQDKTDTEEGLTFTEIIETQDENATPEAETQDDIDDTEEGLTFTEIIETQDENATPEVETQDDIDDDEEFDDSVESSEATGRTSLDSNAEQIWPADLIEEPNKEFKENTVNLRSPQEELEQALATPETKETESDSNLSTEVETDSSKSCSSDCVGNYDYRDMTREKEYLDKTNLHAALDDDDQPSVRVSHPSNLRIWIASVLLALLLLFLLLVFTNRTPLSSYFLHGTSVVVP